MNFQMFKLVLEKAEEPEFKLPTFAGSSKSKRVSEKLYKKDLHDPDNHDGVITHLEPEIL